MKRQYIALCAVVRLTPDALFVRCRPDQLHVDANDVTRGEYGAFHDGIDLELSRDLRNRSPAPPVLRDRRARGYAERGDPSELTHDGVVHSGDVVLLRRIGRQVLEREDGDGRDAPWLTAPYPPGQRRTRRLMLPRQPRVESLRFGRFQRATQAVGSAVAVGRRATQRTP
jgi:hypothetical protein